MRLTIGFAISGSANSVMCYEQRIKVPVADNWETLQNDLESYPIGSPSYFLLLTAMALELRAEIKAISVRLVRTVVVAQW